jgi:hypothetical protein
VLNIDVLDTFRAMGVSRSSIAASLVSYLLFGPARFNLRVRRPCAVR